MISIRSTQRHRVIARLRRFTLIRKSLPACNVLSYPCRIASYRLWPFLFHHSIASTHIIVWGVCIRSFLYFFCLNLFPLSTQQLTWVYIGGRLLQLPLFFLCFVFYLFFCLFTSTTGFFVFLWRVRKKRLLGNFGIVYYYCFIVNFLLRSMSLIFRVVRAGVLGVFFVLYIIISH